MNEQLHTDLNEAFSHHLSNLPQDAVERLRQIDYRPRTRRVSPRVTVGAVSGVAATTAAVVSAVVLTSAAPAFGGWTARPTGSPIKPTASANASCQTQLASLPGAPAGPWSPVVTDVRGPFTLTVYRDGGTYGTCLTGRSLTAVSETSNGLGSTSVQSSAAGTGHAGASRGSILYPGSSGGGLQQLAVQSLSATGQGSYTVADGNVAPDVSALTFVLGNGNQVQTTLSDGWFVAWWPGDVAAVSVQVTTPSGTTTQPVRAPQPPGSGAPGSGTSGTSGSSGSGASGSSGSARASR